MANGINKKTQYTRSLEDILGVELGGSGVNISNRRLAYCENMWRDYQGDGRGIIESVPGYRKLFSLTDRIKSFNIQKTYGKGDFLIINAGNRILRINLANIDSEAPKEILTLQGEITCSFPFGDNFYIFTSNTGFVIDDDGVSKEIKEQNEIIYVPTLFVNGQEFESRNLLCDEFKEEFKIEDNILNARGSAGVVYSVTDPSEKLCAVTGFDSKAIGELYIPNSVRIGDNLYRVTEISDNAFRDNQNITSVTIAEGVTKIGKFAFAKCAQITKVILPQSVTLIDSGCFSDCARLVEIYLGKRLITVGTNAFSSCVSLTKLYYSLSESEYSKIQNISHLSKCEKVFNTSYKILHLEFPLSSDFKEVKTVKIDSKEHTFLLSENNSQKTVTMTFDSPNEIDGKTVTIYGILNPKESNFHNQSAQKNISSKSAIFNCTVTEFFDGKVFLSGNSSIPNTIFYTGYDLNGKNDPTYVPDLNYFNDGVGSYKVISMLAVRDSLAVFKEGDDGGGSIFYHTRESTNDRIIPCIYPCKYVHCGICATGKAQNFLDDPVFPTKFGLCALEHEQINFERSVSIRSHNVNYELLKENLKEVTPIEWLGYLALCINGKIYLADSRMTFQHLSGRKEYEWFVIKGVGNYENSTRVYRYSSIPQKNYSLSSTPDEICETLVYSEGDENGDLVYFTYDGDSKVKLYKTEEFSGGDFKPAKVFFSYNDLLFFGTDNGTVCVFNNDKRGVPPKSIAEQKDFVEEDYKKEFGSVIHPQFYSFDNRSVMYAIKTSFDNCGVPHLEKSTVKHSLVLKLKSYPCTKIHCEVGTDKSTYSEVTEFPSGELDFSDFDFLRLNLNTGTYHTVAIDEKEKGWIEKQITVFANGFQSPLGIYSITYRYTIKGKIKNS